MGKHIEDSGAITRDEAQTNLAVLNEWCDGNDRVKKEMSYYDAVDEGIDAIEADESFLSIFRVV